MGGEGHMNPMAWIMMLRTGCFFGSVLLVGGTGSQHFPQPANFAQSSHEQRSIFAVIHGGNGDDTRATTHQTPLVHGCAHCLNPKMAGEDVLLPKMMLLSFDNARIGPNNG